MANFFKKMFKSGGHKATLEEMDIINQVSLELIAEDSIAGGLGSQRMHQGSGGERYKQAQYNTGAIFYRWSGVYIHD